MLRNNNDRRVGVTERLRNTAQPEQGWIPMFVYSDPDVYELELERVFPHTWLFLAHASELPEPGSFVVRDMGEQSVIVGRGDDDVVRVFLNSCRHRGMKVACEDFGQVDMWRCQYHGFTYGSKGDFMGTLLGAPFERQAYPQGLDRKALSLIEARVETYQGLIFATWDKKIAPLSDFLGDVRWYLDLLFGRAEMEVVGVPQKWVVPSGWKLPADNFTSDAYHTATAHSFMGRLNLTKGVDFGRDGYHVAPDNGHGLGIGTHSDDESYFPPELQEEYRSRLSEEQYELLSHLKNLHGNVFPHMSFLQPNFIDIDGKKVSGLMLRVWQPIGPDKLQVWSWHLIEKNGPDWWKKAAKAAYVQTFGSSGMFDQDDTENWEGQTRNSNTALARDEEIMLHYGMGLGMEPLTEFPGPGQVFDGKFSEAAGRKYWRTWLDLVLKETEK